MRPPSEKGALHDQQDKEVEAAKAFSIKASRQRSGAPYNSDGGQEVGRPKPVEAKPLMPQS